MSLLDYFLGRRRAKRANGAFPLLPIPHPILPPAIPLPPIAPDLKLPPRFDRAKPRGPQGKNKPGDPPRSVAQISAIDDIALLFQKEAYAWEATAKQLAEIVADVIMPDAGDDERLAYAREIAYEIMKAELAGDRLARAAVAHDLLHQ